MSSKTILLTGAGSGIGKAVALQLSRRGHTVIATTHTNKQAKDLLLEAQADKLTLESFVLDVTKPDDQKKILKYDLDVLINNAGMGETGSLAEINLDKVRHNFEVNLFAPLALTQLALKPMMQKRSGTVIFISSLLGRVTSPFFGPYSMSKFALSSGAEMLHNELKKVTDTVHVAIIEPGAFHTGFNQAMIEKKFAWMDKNSYFAGIQSQIRQDELRQFSLMEQKNLHSIVDKIVATAEAEKPRLRGSAPWWQGLGAYLLRVAGK